jgi:hypothetical protein
MARTVFHLSIDEANLDLGRGWGAEAGLDMQTLFPKDWLFPAEADGLVIDLDHLCLTPFERAQFARQLCVSTLPYPVAVTSYNLEAEEIEALEAKGVLVVRRLDRALFGRLAEAINASRGRDAAA